MMSGDSIDLFELPAESGGRKSSDVLFQTRPANNPDFVCYKERAGSPVAFVHRRVFDHMRVESQRALPNETIGILLGRVCRDESGTYVLVMAAGTAINREYEGTPGGVRISVAGKATLGARSSRRWPGWEVVGWWHSHPHGAPRFSPEDFREQATQGINHLGIVVAADRYSGNGSAGPRDPIGVYLGPHGELLEAMEQLVPSQAHPTFPTTPPSTETAARPVTVVIGKQIMAAVGVLMLAGIALAWWTQNELGSDISAQVARPVRTLLSEAPLSRPLALLHAQTCDAGKGIRIRLSIPTSMQAATVASSDNPSVATARLFGDASGVSVACLAPGEATIALISRLSGGSRAAVPIVVLAHSNMRTATP